MVAASCQCGLPPRFDLPGIMLDRFWMLIVQASIAVCLMKKAWHRHVFERCGFCASPVQPRRSSRAGNRSTFQEVPTLPQTILLCSWFNFSCDDGSPRSGAYRCADDACHPIIGVRALWQSFLRVRRSGIREALKVGAHETVPEFADARNRSTWLRDSSRMYIIGVFVEHLSEARW